MITSDLITKIHSDFQALPEVWPEQLD
jgi:hypothetical protein